MTDPITKLVAEEEAKLRLLEAEVLVRRQRIEVLKSAAKALQGGDDAIDAALTGRMASQAPNSTLNPAQAKIEWPVTPPAPTTQPSGGQALGTALKVMRRILRRQSRCPAFAAFVLR